MRVSSGVQAGGSPLTTTAGGRQVSILWMSSSVLGGDCANRSGQTAKKRLRVVRSLFVNDIYGPPDARNSLAKAFVAMLRRLVEDALSARRLRMVLGIAEDLLAPSA